MDVYQFMSTSYRIQTLMEELPINIGEKTPIPIIENSGVFFVDPDWTEIEIRQFHKDLSNEAVKAFVSLRTRLAIKAQESAQDNFSLQIDELLKEPVSSKYWVSRFRALVRSAFQANRPPEALVEQMKSVRDDWLKRFATKMSLPMVQLLCDLSEIPLTDEGRKKVLLHRFEQRFASKGIRLPKSELADHKRLFPEGIVSAISDDSLDRPEYWARTSAIGKLVDDQLFHVFDTRSELEVDDPRKWSISELERLLLLFEVLDGNTYLFESAGTRFEPIRIVVLNQLLDLMSSRYEWTNALSGRDYSAYFLRYRENLLEIPSAEGFRDIERLINIIAGVERLYKKLTVLTKIIRPPARKKADSELVFPELDHALLDVLLEAHRKKDPIHILTLLKPERHD